MKQLNLNEPIFLLVSNAEVTTIVQNASAESGLRLELFTNPQALMDNLFLDAPFLLIVEGSLVQGSDLIDKFRETHPTAQVIILIELDNLENFVLYSSETTQIVPFPIQEELFKPSIIEIATRRTDTVKTENKELQEVTKIFIEEAQSITSQLDSLFIHLEENPTSESTLDELFRKVHTLKGSSGALEQAQTFSKVAHELETVLSKMQKKELKPERDVFDVFLFASDLITRLLELIKVGEEPTADLKEEADACIAKLKGVLAAQKAAKPPPAEVEFFTAEPPTQTPPISATELSAAPTPAASAPEPATTPSAAQIIPFDIPSSETTIASPQIELPPISEDIKPGIDLPKPSRPPGEMTASDDEEGIYLTGEQIDSFMRVSADLIVLKNSFQNLGREIDLRLDPERYEKRQAEIAFNLNKITDQLQEQLAVMSKVSLSRALNKIPRVARQTAQEVNKRIQLKTDGFDLRIDKNIAKAIGSCVVHMIRNSIDHGIEGEQERIKEGKPAEGQITLRAQESSGIIQFSVSDDGRGLDPKKIMKKALEKGIVKADDTSWMGESDVLDLIFASGFSTSDKVTNVSGRGVGLDAVKSAVVGLGGGIRIENTPGKGTTFALEIPIPKAVAVDQTVLCSWNNHSLAVPLQSIARISSCSELKVTMIDEIRYCQYDELTIPMLTYAEMLSGKVSLTMEEVNQRTAIVIRHKNFYVCMVVDTILGQLEAVVRSFDMVVKAVPGYKGTCVLGDEQIAYIISPEDLVQIMRKIK